MGADDLFAILVAERVGGVAGLSTSFGCAGLAQVERNAAGAARAFGWSFPVTRGAARPVLGPVETVERILGPMGMQTRGAYLPDARPDHGPALPALTGWIAGGGAVLALGPLTNIATAMLARPDLPLERIVWMGGSTGRGNHTPFAEYNAVADPCALAILLDRGVTIDMIDLEACRKVTIGEDEVARVRASGGPNAALLADLLGGYLDIALTRGRARMALYDPVAAVAATQPLLFEMTPIRLRVDLSDGDTRAQTVVTEGPPNARVVRGLEAEAVRAAVLNALEAA